MITPDETRLPENDRIKELIPIHEIAAMMDSGDYSAEMLLQHLCIHWNRRDEWQPIETAPKDGSEILIWRNRNEIGRWDDDRYAGMPKPYWRSHSVFGKTHERSNPPTHWQPMPKPPSEKSHE